MPSAESVIQQQKKGPTAAERLMKFSRATRKYPRRYGTKTVNAGETLRFSLEKVRLSSHIRLLVSATVTAVHAANTTFTNAANAPYTLIKNVSVSANLSYTPWKSSGVGAMALMYCQPQAAAFQPVYSDADTRKWAYMGVKSSAGGGTVNKLAFALDIPLVTNKRDLIGMILTQNQETQVDVEIDFADINALIATGLAGYTFTLSQITVTPVVTTFAVPREPEAIPDLTIIKQVGEQKKVTTAGRDDYKLPTGATFRRIAFMLTDATGAPVDDSTLGDLEVTLNTSDVVTKIPARQLTLDYIEETGVALPPGVWVLDFTSQGLINYGGGRDYVDAERLNEFWLTIVHPQALNLTVTYETLAQMKG
jgi:hypothetical protein